MVFSSPIRCVFQTTRSHHRRLEGYTLNFTCTMGHIPISSVMLRATLFCLLICLGSSQTAPLGPETLLQELSFQFYYGPLDGYNRFTSFMVPRVFATTHTPITVRWSVLFMISYHDVHAGCNPSRLSFFGTNDTIPSEICNHPLGKTLIPVYAVNYIYRKQYPVLGLRLTQYLVSLGLTPLSKSNDLNTFNGWGNVFGGRVHNYFKEDGWNALGAPRKDFKNPYYDRTGYEPKNPAGVPEKHLKYPLRWQPLIQTNKLGSFFIQQHVTPHLGRTAKPLLTPREALFKRRTKGPYRFPNRRTIHRMDRRQIIREARKLFAISAGLTIRQIQEAFFWDVKLYSTGMTSFLYTAQFVRQGLIKPQQAADTFASWAIAEAVAMHDATILAWHEKRRHDIARPQTLIRRIFKHGKQFQSFRGFGRGYGRVHAVEWESLIPSQPHSEYPSGSAMLCTANYETLDLDIREFLHIGQNETVPPLVISAPPNAVYTAPLLNDVNFTFNGPSDMARRCGRSRLWAGVHFSQSVYDGAKAAKGIGRMSHDFFRDLRNGKVPKHCRHCLL